jgi:hypothetical protein
VHVTFMGRERKVYDILVGKPEGRYLPTRLRGVITNKNVILTAVRTSDLASFIRQTKTQTDLTYTENKDGTKGSKHVTDKTPGVRAPPGQDCVHAGSLPSKHFCLTRPRRINK